MEFVGIIELKKKLYRFYELNNLNEPNKPYELNELY